MTFIFDVAAFRIAYPAFANVTTYPDALLQAYWNSAGCFISMDDYGWLTGTCRYTVLNLMTAHLAMIAVLAAADPLNPAGKTPGFVQQATVDKVSISLKTPELKNQWQWWLSLTPYGQQLFAILQVNSAGGFYFGGLPETSAFRKVGGIF